MLVFWKGSVPNPPVVKALVRRGSREDTPPTPQFLLWKKRSRAITNHYMLIG